MKRVACVLLALGIALGTALEPAADARPKTTTHDTLSAALQAETEKEEPNMKKQICTVLLAMMLTLNGCGGDTEPAVTDTTTTATTTTTAAAITTTTEDVAEITTTDSTTATDAEITTTDTELQVTTTTSAPTTKAPTTTKVPVTTTKPTTTAAPVVETTTTSVPTTTTVPTTATPTTAGKVPNYDDPWQWPCDWQGMEADCKAYVESQGWQWDANLNVDKGSWSGKRHTVWNELWENYDVFSVSIQRDIKKYAEQGDAYFKCVFIPDEDHDGHYHIYIVHSSSSYEGRADLVLHEEFADLAQKAVN